MPKKKTSYAETAEQIVWTPKVEIKERSHDLRSMLDKVKTREGVIGYILRAASSATVDIKDPSKIIDYAVLSTSVIEAAESLLEVFHLGNVGNVVVKGNDLKMLLLTIGDQRITVFMEKNVDHNLICNELVP